MYMYMYMYICMKASDFIREGSKGQRLHMYIVHTCTYTGHRGTIMHVSIYMYVQIHYILYAVHVHVQVCTARKVSDFIRERSKVISSMGDSVNASSVDGAIYKMDTQHMCCIHNIQCIYNAKYMHTCMLLHIHVHVHVYTLYTAPSVSGAALKSQEHYQSHLSMTQCLK